MEFTKFNFYDTLAKARVVTLEDPGLNINIKGTLSFLHEMLNTLMPSDILPKDCPISWNFHITGSLGGVTEGPHNGKEYMDCTIH